MIYRKITYLPCRACGDQQTAIVKAEKVIDYSAFYCFCGTDVIAVHSTEIITPDKPIKVTGQAGGLKA